MRRFQIRTQSASPRRQHVPQLPAHSYIAATTLDRLVSDLRPIAARSMLRAMGTALEEAILSLTRRAGETGLAMGHLVDHLVEDGASAEDAELAIWRLMQRRRLNPIGFRVQQNKIQGRTQRLYEFVLIEWSPEQDLQLEFDLASERSTGAKVEAKS